MGATACVVLITEDHIFCANAGDSRAVLCQKSEAIPLSFDHKPDNEQEKERIEDAGSSVRCGRVGGNLAVSRAIGDHYYKHETSLPAQEQAVTCFPDVLERKRDSGKDEFIIIACDGVWDVKDN